MDTQNTTPPPASNVPPTGQSTPPPGGSQPTHNNNGMAVLCYLGILVILPLLTEAKNDPFVKFHIKQGLVLLVFWVLGSVFFWIPFLGWLLWVGIVVLAIMGIMHALNGEQKELPVIGKYAEKFHI